jgi:hypothetical protein
VSLRACVLQDSHTYELEFTSRALDSLPFPGYEHAYTQIHTYMHVYTHVHTYMHAYEYTCIHTYILPGVDLHGRHSAIPRLRTCMYIVTYIHAYIHTYITHLHKNMHAYKHTYTHTYYQGWTSKGDALSFSVKLS